ncbi:MAG TPA: TonB family protein [Pyrinomonadaceae bacterium]|nr:TonB family protein [Pyrinomonadaceae bacterium]
MPRRIIPTLLFVLFLASSATAAPRGLPRFPSLAPAFATNDREQDGLVGPVRRVKTETAKVTVKGGKPSEGPRVLLEATTYDMKGDRVDNAYYLAAGGTLTGKEVYKYDERGNMVEMTLHNADGSLLSKETYAYEFDAVGNWVKMTTSVAVIEAGRVTFEPSEVTYRTIAYYLDEGMLAKMSPPSAGASAAPAASATQPSAATTQPSAAKPATQPLNKPASPPAGKSAGTPPAPVVLASLDKAALAAPPPALSSSASAAAAAPVVKLDGEAPSQPARPVTRGPLKPVSGGILNGKALSLPAPSYPEVAKRSRAAGTVEVEVVIDLSGKVISAKAVKGPMMLQNAAEEAARRAKFSPTLLSGQPVRVSGVITYNFSLQ